MKYDGLAAATQAMQSLADAMRETALAIGRYAQWWADAERRGIVVRCKDCGYLICDCQP